MSLNADIRKYLKLSKETQADYARRAGVTPMTLTHYLKRRRVPKPVNEAKLRAAMVFPVPERPIDPDPTLSPGTNASDYPR